MSWSQRHPLAIPWAYMVFAWVAYLVGFVSLFWPTRNLHAFWLEWTAAIIAVMLCVTWRPSS